MKRKVFYMLCLVAMSLSLYGQTDQRVIQDFQQKTQAEITLNKSTGIPDFIRFPKEAPQILEGSTERQKTSTFIQLNAQLFGVQNLNQSLSFKQEDLDQIGFKHLTYQQSYEGVPVFDGQLKFHFNNRKELQSINGVIIPKIRVNTTPSLSPEGAAIFAINHIENQSTRPLSNLRSANEELYLFKKGLVQGVDGPIHLVYEIEVTDEGTTREFVYVDAHSGEIVEQFTGNHGALFRRLYEADLTNEVWTEGDAFPGLLNIWQRNELEAAAHTYYLFFNSFNYDSYDGAGAEMLTINNFNQPGFCPNASWNGVTANFCVGLASDDVVAHEWGHAYTEYTSGLIYAWQPGALNESYSDIWGETVDLLNMYEDTGEDLSIRTGCNSSQRWRLGEDTNGGALRDMWDPTCSGDPGKVSDNQYFCSTGDNGGVHSNSGVNNHAYALLIDGGTYNGQTITGIGILKAAHIFWRAQSMYLTRSSGFAANADALEISCNDLIGVNLEGISMDAIPAGPSGEMITAGDLTQLQNVMAAVEMRLDPSCVFFPLLAPAPPTCLEALPSTAIFYEDFESGLTGWTLDQIPSNPGTWDARDWVIESSLPEDRPGSAVFGINPVNGDCDTDLENGIMRLESPLINIPPATTGTILLSFDHYVAIENLWDGVNIKYNLNNGGWVILPSSAFTVNPYNGSINTLGQGNDNPMEGQPAFTGTDGGFVTGSWGLSTIDLTNLGVTPGDDIQFRFDVGSDGCNGSSFGWYIDDIRIYVCADCTNAVVTNEIWDVEHALLDADQSVTSTDLIEGSARIMYSANEIILNEDFEVSPGAILEVNNDGCDLPAPLRGQGVKE